MSTSETDFKATDTTPIPLDADLAARTATANALRDLAHAFVNHNASIESIEAMGAWARSAAADYVTAPVRDRMALMRASREMAEREGGDQGIIVSARSGYEDRAVAGKANPTGVDIVPREYGDVIIVDVLFRKAFEGPPGRVHGGMVAAVFDDVTGYIIGRRNTPAFTGELTVRLVAPVPINTQLEFRTWLESEAGRKLFIHAEALADGKVVATCKAIYISVDPSLFAGSSTTA